MKMSMRRASLGARYWAMSNPRTSPAICEVKVEGSKRVMRLIPDLPATMLVQLCATPMPTGAMIPSPVTTTLRLAKWAPERSGLDVTLDVIDGLLDRGDLLRLFVGNLRFELFLQRHH